MSIESLNNKICTLKSNLKGTTLSENNFELFTGEAKNGYQAVEVTWDGNGGYWQFSQPTKITLDTHNAGLVFWSLTGALYLDEGLSQPVTLNTKYTSTDFWYDASIGVTTGSYLYDYSGGRNDSAFRSACATCTKDFLTSRYNDGSVTTLFGTYDYCWSVTLSSGSKYYRLSLSTGEWSSYSVSNSYFRCNSTNF